MDRLTESMVVAAIGTFLFWLFAWVTHAIWGEQVTRGFEESQKKKFIKSEVPAKSKWTAKEKRSLRRSWYQIKLDAKRENQRLEKFYEHYYPGDE